MTSCPHNEEGWATYSYSVYLLSVHVCTYCAGGRWRVVARVGGAVLETAVHKAESHNSNRQ